MDVAERFWSKVDKSGDCWLWTGATYPNGYGAFRFGRIQTTASRVSFQITFGEIPAGYVICHKCDNPPCVRPDHLFAGTQLENMQDRIQKGRINNGVRNQGGERNNNAKLSWPVVDSIRELHRQGLPQAEIARMLDVSRLNIWNVVHDKSWVRSNYGE